MLVCDFLGLMLNVVDFLDFVARLHTHFVAADPKRKSPGTAACAVAVASQVKAKRNGTRH